jgi:hypothetical protein
MTAALRNRKVRLPCVNHSDARGVQDAIAKRLGIDDGDQSKVRWVYEQRATGKHQYGLEVKIEAAEAMGKQECRNT